MDLISSIINFARILGSFICFQLEEATFSVGGEYFPVCSGCFGIYLGSVIALSALPHYEKISKSLYSIKYGLPMVLPLTVYWLVLNVQQSMGIRVMPAIKEVYSFFGAVFGITVANAAYNLGIETLYSNKISKVGKHFGILTTAVITIVLVTLVFHGTQSMTILAASLVFVLGFFGLAGFIVMWIFVSMLSLKKGSLSSSRDSAAILTVLTIFVSFLFFQMFIFENRLEAITIGLFFGILAFVLFAFTVRKFNWKDLGITSIDWKKQLVYGIIIGVGLYLAFLLCHFVSSGFNESIALNSFDALGILAVFAIVTSEELFFRGYTIAMLERRTSTEIACLTSSILFTLYHYTEAIKSLIGLSDEHFYFEYEYFAMLFFGGLLLAFLFVKKRSLVMPISVHFIWNLLIMVVTFHQ